MSKLKAIFDRKAEQETAEDSGGKDGIERQVSLDVDAVGVEGFREVLIG